MYAIYVFIFVFFILHLYVYMYLCLLFILSRSCCKLLYEMSLFQGNKKIQNEISLISQYLFLVENNAIKQRANGDVYLM